MIEEAALAPVGLGAAASVGPPAAALPLASSPSHHPAIMGALLGIGTVERAAVTRALTDAASRERAPHVRARAREALTALIMTDIAPTA